MSKPLKVFITYSHTDSAEKDKLITRLAVMKRKGLISIWHDNEILGGDKWREEIFSTNLPNSDLLLYLVSAKSLESENCNKELAIALDEKIRVIPIILEDCDWKNDQLSDFQAFPERGKPINEWNPESKGWQSAVDGIRKVIKGMQFQVHPSPTITPEEIKILSFWTLQKGNFLMMLKQIDEALKAYSRAIELSPNNAEAYYNRGIAYCHRSDNVLSIIEDFKKAIENFNKVIELNPNCLRAYAAASNTYYELATCYYGESDRDLAIENYTKAIQLQPDCFDAYEGRGAAYCDKGAYDLAIKDYTKMIEISPNKAISYYIRSITYQRKGQINRAIEDYNKAIQLEPDNPFYKNRSIAPLGPQE